MEVIVLRSAFALALAEDDGGGDTGLLGLSLHL